LIGASGLVRISACAHAEEASASSAVLNIMHGMFIVLSPKANVLDQATQVPRLMPAAPPNPSR
jgi:hypothetical protein